jgi:hypothetical protein
MATAKDMNVKGFCDTTFVELSGMHKKLVELRDNLARTYGAESPIFGVYERHLCELADQIEWKLQILAKACPYDWKGSAEGVESVVSVGQPEKIAETEFSGGYVGG